MDSFEWNKIAGWTLASVLLVLVIRTGVEVLYEPHAPEADAYPIAVPEGEGEGNGDGGQPAAAQQGPSLAM
ncbi:MAG: cytochrome c family protein, partial [Alphaproteobacteria bacterium]